MPRQPMQDRRGSHCCQNLAVNGFVFARGGGRIGQRPPPARLHEIELFEIGLGNPAEGMGFTGKELIGADANDHVGLDDA